MSTIHDVAKRAGVSAMTVSRVINHSHSVSPTTRARVEAAIAELGFVPNTLARSLRMKGTKTLALILSDITNPFFTTLGRGVQDAARAAGFNVIFCNTDESETEQAEQLITLVQKRVDGVLLVPAASAAEPVAYLMKHKIPVVVLDRRVQDCAVDSVRCDSELGAYQLTRLLLNLGHRRIAMLSGPEAVSTANDRVAGYQRALAEAGLGLDAQMIAHGTFSVSGGHQMAQAALACTPRPTALFAANNFIAIGAYRYLQEAGLQTPEEISIVTFDDMPLSAMIQPFFTVAAQPAYEMGQQAVHLLLARLDGTATEPCRETILPFEMIVRRSSGGQIGKSANQQIGKSANRQIGKCEACPERSEGVSRKLSSRERVLMAFAHRTPDHVPCWLGASPEWKELARQHLGLADDERLLNYLGDDFRRVHSRYAGPQDTHPTANLSHPDATYRTPFGVERHGYGYGMPLNIPLKQATTVAEVHAYPWPDPAWMDVSHIRAEALKYDRRYAILGGEWSPFWHDAIDLLDFDRLILQMYDNPALVDAVMAHCADYYLAISRRIFEASGDAIDIFFIGNDFGAQAGPMLSPKFFRRFILPQLKRFADLGHEFGKYVLLHCDGSIRSLLPDMIAIGLDGMQSVQPLCHGMGLRGLKRDFGGQFTFVGGIDTQALIEGTAAQARQLTRRTLEIMMPGGGFVASPSHDYLLPETPVENVIVMYEMIKECGGYR